MTLLAGIVALKVINTTIVFPRTQEMQRTKGDPKHCVAQHTGPLRGPANESKRTQKTQSQGEEQQEAQLRVVGPDDGGVLMN